MRSWLLLGIFYSIGFGLFSLSPKFGFAAGQENVPAPSRGADETKVPTFNAKQLEFFEKEVRPILIERCYECHGPEVDEPAGGLSLASRKDILVGGDTGAAIEPGDTTRSLLIEAVRYGERVQMPPDQKMSLDEIATLMRWVEDKSPWPADEDVRSSSGNEFDLQGRRNSHWAWQTISNPELPDVKQTHWASQPLDRFVLAKLEENGLNAADLADDATWLRRVYFDLSGLPPTAQRVQEFLAAMKNVDADGTDPNEVRAEIRTKVVDQLLAAPTFGERWGRHWLDLVRYAETAGHEFDYPILNAHEYRDYVIRAFNSDVGYDRLVMEHIAGDLLPVPRMNSENRFNESQIATAFWYLGETNHAPVDVLGDEANRMDNQIDVFGKTFLGMTIACARCHDHKFDAISAEDYYSLAGILQSTRRDIGIVDEDQEFEKTYQKLIELRSKGSQLLLKQEKSGSGSALQSADILQLLQVINQTHQLQGADTIGVNDLRNYADVDEAGGSGEQTKQNETADGKPILKTQQGSIDLARLDGVVRRLIGSHDLAMDQKHPMRILRSYASRSPEISVQKWWAGFREEILAEDEKAKSFQANAILISNFSIGGMQDWKDTGWAFRNAIDTIEGFEFRSGAWRVRQPDVIDSGSVGPNMVGYLRSPTFEITAPRFHFRLKGSEAKVRLVIDSYRMDQYNGLLFGDCMATVSSAGFDWRTLSGDIGKYIGHRAFIELIDDGGGEVVVDEIWMGGESPAAEPSPLLTNICRERQEVTSIKEVAEILSALLSAVNAESIEIPRDRQQINDDQSIGRSDQSFGQAAEQRRQSDETIGQREAGRRQRSFRESIDGDLSSVKKFEVSATDRAAIAQWTLEFRLEIEDVQPDTSSDSAPLLDVTTELQQLQNLVLPMRTFYAAASGTGEDQAVYIRGNHKNLGTLAPRGLISALQDGHDSEARLDSKQLDVLPGDFVKEEPIEEEPTGRLRLAREIVSSANPLTSRVMVNRVWHLLLGRGIVASTDNFGVLGEVPTHPELLDHLATTFMNDQWSMKRLVRRIVLSSTYRMSSESNVEAWQVDPKNELLHCAKVRRLEGEVIRDAMLFVSGRLNAKMYGPSVPTHVTDFMQGRGRPSSGPLDGDNRRSVYLEVRRNFLNPFMLAFDTPAPFSTNGRRNESNVPAQSLTMLNDPLVNMLAETWAQKVVAEGSTDEERLRQMYWDAVGRGISESESRRYLQFIESMSKDGDDKSSEAEIWTAVAHAVFNLKEFMYLR